MAGIALLLDFDGTIADLAPQPDAVKLEPGLASAIVAVRQNLGGALAVITGRTINAIDRFIGLIDLDVWGLHGAEHRRARIVTRADAEAERDMRHVIDELRCGIGAKPGIFIEDKGAAVGVHWRLNPSLAPEAIEAVCATAAELGPRYKTIFGKSVGEIAPQSSDKGDAIALLMARAPYLGHRPVFIGDDLTDERGFTVVNKMNGISVRVGEGASAARYRLKSAAAVRLMLLRWARSIPERPESEFDA